jgi:lactate permease
MLLIAFAFGSFLEGTAGFGAPVAITAAMLVGMGFNPLRAAGLCMIANTAPVAFASLGIPVIVAADVSGLEVMRISRAMSLQLPWLALLVPFWLCLVLCGGKKALHIWPAWLLAGVSAAAAQALMAYFHGPALPSIVSALASGLSLIVLLRFWQPKDVMTVAGASSDAGGKHKPLPIIRAFSPFILLAALIFLWGLNDIKQALDYLFLQNIPWPGLHLKVQQAWPLAEQATPINAIYVFNPVSSGGSAAFAAGLLAVFTMGQYSLRRALSCLARTIYVLRLSILSIAVIMGLGYLMNFSGLSSSLGLAFTHSGAFFPLFAPLLGWLGVFLTGSDTSSNALFGGVQKATAQMMGLDPALTVAANASGGVTGKMISPQSIAIGCAASGQVGREGDLLRFTLLHSLLMLALICLLVWLQAG